jgi:hypothetical protein
MKITLKAAFSSDTEVLVRHLDMKKNRPKQMKTVVIAIIKSCLKKAEEFYFNFEDGDNATFLVKRQGVVILKIEFGEEDDADTEEEEEEEDSEDEDEDWSEEEEYQVEQEEE